MVEPPLPMTEPAAAFDTRNRMCVGFSAESLKKTKSKEDSNQIKSNPIHDVRAQHFEVKGVDRIVEIPDSEGSGDLLLVSSSEGAYDSVDSIAR